MKARITYDHLNRLTDISLNGVPTGHMVYDALGRMTDKRADGQQVFASAQHDYVGPDGQLRPHAVSSATVEGNPFPTELLDIDYTMFDKVRLFQKGTTTVEFDYGYDHRRTRMSNAHDSLTIVKTYVAFVSG
ncbi:MAG: hypothetical protein IKG95_00665 [Bacteroidales bacterium]|nr:hypothetical protein [Bacteroidales bacterium]